MKTLVVFLFAVGVITEANAQHGIRMSSRSSNRQKFVPEGTRVFYEEYGNRNNFSNHQNRLTGVGILHVLNDSTIQVGSEVIKTADLVRFGTRKKGAGIPSALFIVSGFLMAEGATSRNENGEEVTDPVLIVASLMMTTAGLVAAIKRVPKNSSKWRFEVVR